MLLKKIKTKICLNCGKEFQYKEKCQKFCCCECSGLYVNKHRNWKMNDETKKKISQSLINNTHRKNRNILTVQQKIDKYNKNPKHCIVCNNIITYKRRKAKTCCTECYIKRLTSTSKEKCGGVRECAGYGKKGWYKGYYCDSSWELAYVIYNIDHNIQFERYKKYIEYTYNNINHKYYPDFILKDGTLIEIKGYESDQWEAKKLECIKNHKLILINKDGIKPYIEYCIKMYGKNYTNLYEKEVPIE